MVNKRGWIKTVEAVVAIILMAAIVFVVVGDRGPEGGIREEVYNIQVSTLREIQLNDSLREEIVGTSGEVEFENFPPDTKSKIEGETPSYLTCEAKICSPGASCLLSEEVSGEVYTEDIIVSSTLSSYRARVLKMFCWAGDT